MTVRLRLAVLILVIAIVFLNLVLTAIQMWADVVVVASNGRGCPGECNCSSVIPTTATGPSIVSDEEFSYCQDHNLVLARSDMHMGVTTVRTRPYTITAKSFQNFHEQPCSNIPDLMKALRLGTRSWIKPEMQNMPSLVREQEQSYFVPHGCDISPLSHRQICDILNQYSHVLLLGNSLTRQLRQALFMAIRNDYIHGAILSNITSGSSEVNPYHSCRCDGQFSEHAVCRQNNQLFWDMTPRQLHVCPFLEDDTMPFFRLMTPRDGQDPLALNATSQHPAFPWNEIRCNDPKYRGIFLMMSGLWHNQKRAMRNMEGLFLRYMNHPVFQECANAGKLKVVWINFHAQSRKLDTQYPFQTRENTTTLNQDMVRLLAEQGYGHIPIFDVFNLTLDAQTSDGYHFMSDVNLLKAYVVLTAANLMARELKKQ